jgi:hypothetical protein
VGAADAPISLAMAEQVAKALEALYHGEPGIKDQANK